MMSQRRCHPVGANTPNNAQVIGVTLAGFFICRKLILDIETFEISFGYKVDDACNGIGSRKVKRHRP